MRLELNGLRGSIVALVTPMDGLTSPYTAIDEASIKGLIDFHVESQTKAIVVVGTTGESATLTSEEHCNMISKVVAEADGRIPVIAGTGSNSTHEALFLTKEAKARGADAALIVTPYYNRPTQKGLFEHHKIIANEVNLPQILYNVPSRTACDMEVETVIKLSRLDNIVGVKEASGQLNRVKAIRESCKKNFLIYSGEDSNAKDFILQGGDGVISVTANVAPAKMSKMCEAAIEKDLELATQLNNELMLLHENLFIEANPIPVKWAVEQIGLIKKGIRLPLTELSSVNHENVKIAMDRANLLNQ